MLRLKTAGYQTATQQTLLAEHKFSHLEAACLEFYIALTSAKFAGNSVSVFSALQILEHQSTGVWASYYNGENIVWILKQRNQPPLLTKPSSTLEIKPHHQHTLCIFTIPKWIPKALLNSPRYDQD